jgi:hypothetical protein
MSSHESNSGSLVPIAIAAPIERVQRYEHAPWELLYDDAEIRRRRHRHGEQPRHVVRRLRVDAPMDLVEPATVPLDEREHEPWEARRRERRTQVEAIAERIIRGDGAGVNLAVDFDLERSVLDELWRRWREVVADSFLVSALEREPE